MEAGGSPYERGHRARGFRELLVWQKAMDLVTEVYSLTADWPSDERFGLTSQARRAAISIPSNLAEGQGRIGSGEFARFVSIAHGSLCELETQLELAIRLSFSSEDRVRPLMSQIAEVGRMTRALYDSLLRSRPNGNGSRISEDEFIEYE
jgi:four helix bundle protein